jgi:hypothetical protein
MRRKWLRMAASLRAAIALLAPVSSELHPRRSSNPSVEQCVVDGWLLRARRVGGAWRRVWGVLKLEGLLLFDGVAERVPVAHVPLHGHTQLERLVHADMDETDDAEPADAESADALGVERRHTAAAQHRRPREAFSLRTGSRVLTFACEPAAATPSARRLASGSAGLNEWLHGLRLVLDARAQGSRVCA